MERSKPTDPFLTLDQDGKLSVHHLDLSALYPNFEDFGTYTTFKFNSLTIGTIYLYPRYWNRGDKFQGHCECFQKMLYMNYRKTSLAPRGTDKNYSPPMRKVRTPAQGDDCASARNEAIWEL